MTENSPPKIGAILLAAGGSSRLGQPKQLLKFQGKTLLRRASETLLASKCSDIVVVLGAELERSTAELSGLPLKIFVNQKWKDGMSSSITAGLQQMLNVAPDITAVVVTLSDQPYITSPDIDGLIGIFQRTQTAIIAAEYSGILGVPALFSREQFGGLLRLTGDKGARDLIRSQSGKVRPLPMKNAIFDIDSSADARKLI